MHGHSSVVRNVLLNAARRGKKFNVILTESLPHGQGEELKKLFEQNHISAKLISDSAVAVAI